MEKIIATITRKGTVRIYQEKTKDEQVRFRKNERRERDDSLNNKEFN